VNPFEFIHSNVPGSSISVSKVKPDSIIFFELMELFQVFNINDILSLKHKINIAHLTHNYTSTNYLLNMLREENEDKIISQDFNYDKLYKLFIENALEHKLDLIICEFYPEEYNDTKKFINNMILILLIVLKYQINNGTCIIKIDNIYYKAVIDVIFILSGVYDRIYLVKPSISNITKGERYLICKGFNENLLDKTKFITSLEENIILKMNNNDLMNDKCVSSIIENELPYYLLNKLEESNIVIGQQQLEAYDQIINIFKNKNREEKIENIKRTHIQKCIQWCEKNQLPHNKFTDKVNIFLSPKKKQSDEEYKSDC
jgi:23S rRNA U2552 (ribose-2'-O)-methylase RlmE/FtsJ